MNLDARRDFVDLGLVEDPNDDAVYIPVRISTPIVLPGADLVWHSCQMVFITSGQ